MNNTGEILTTFDDNSCPRYLLSHSEGGVLVADYMNDCILLLSSQLEFDHVLIDGTNSQVKLCYPLRLCYRYDEDELVSQLYVVHSASGSAASTSIALFSLD